MQKECQGYERNSWSRSNFKLTVIQADYATYELVVIKFRNEKCEKKVIIGLKL